ncbi:MAG: sulfotransferase [Betaproteobacteria bacterium]|nr:sulfotransferase [Betaproteobacteria bacterium]
MWNILSDALRGPAQARAAHRQALRHAPSVAAGVRQLQALCPADATDDPEAPIFLLSAGWRSGSTMLQRLLMSDPGVLIWGEPYDECGLIQAVAEGAKAFRPGWPPREYFYDGTPPDQLTGEWIANLFPALDDWRRGQRALFDTMFAQPARRAGARRWGIKEVRLTSDHALFLRWLYPRAKFLLLYRDPLEAYRSYSAFGRSWYDTFPDRPVFTPTQFGRHWRQLMEGYRRDAAELGALLVKYEDLVSGGISTATLDAYLGIAIDPGVISRKVGSSEKGGKKVSVNRLERYLLQRAVGQVARELGYLA